MRLKKIIASITVYLFIIMILPFSFITKEAHALNNDGVSVFNEANTIISNKYGISGRILQSKQYEDYSVIMTVNNLYYIKNGIVQKYNLSKVFKNSNIIKSDKSFIVAPYYNNMSYKLLRVDTDTNKAYADELSRYLPNLNKYYNLQEVNIDNKGNKWLSVSQYTVTGIFAYRLLRADGINPVKEMSRINLNSFDMNHYSGYEEAFTGLTFDSKGNAWSKVTQFGFFDDSYNRTYKLSRINTEGVQSIFSFDDYIREYKIASDETVWAISKENVIHQDLEGKVINSFKGKNIKSLDIDSLGNIWILDDLSVKKLENNTFVTKYTTSYDRNRISVNDDKKLMICGTRGITFVSNGVCDSISIGSSIYNNAEVIRGEDGKARIFSFNNYDGYYDDYRTIDNSVSIAQKNSDGKVTSSVNNIKKYMNYSEAKEFNGNTYIPFLNTIYKMSRIGLEDYAEVDKNTYIHSMIINSIGDIYALSEDKIFKIHESKKIETKDLDTIASKYGVNNNISYKRFDKLIKDKNGNIFAIADIYDSSQQVKKAIYSLNNFNNITEMYYYTDNQNMPVNIFLNEENELQFIFKDNYSNIFATYKLDVNDSLVKDERFDEQGSDFNNKLSSIKAIKSTANGRIILWCGYNSIYVKNAQDKYFKLNHSMLSYDTINSMIADDNGEVYVGTYNNGVIVFNDSYEGNNAINSVEQWMNEKTNIDPGKVWKIKFNSDLDAQTVNENNINVYNSELNRVKVSINYDEASKSVEIRPLTQYSAGNTYYLIINKNVQSMNSSNLKKTLGIKFIIK